MTSDLGAQETPEHGQGESYLRLDPRHSIVQANVRWDLTGPHPSPDRQVANRRAYG